MEITQVIQSITIISIMITIGAIISKTFRINEDTRKVFISIIVNVAMPCIILSSIFHVEMNEKRFKMIMLVFCLSVIINIIGIGLGWVFSGVFYRSSTNRKELALLSGLGNTGFIGIPLCAVLLGPEGALYAAIFDAGVDFTIWTLGVFMLQNKKSFSIQTFKSMINIPIIAIIGGLVISYVQFKPPTLIIDLVDQLSKLAAPLAMFYIGILVMTLQRSKVKSSRTKIWLPITTKLLILPGIVALIILYIKLPLSIVQVILIQSMMPTLTLASILFAKYYADEDIGAITTVVSTLVALLTIPFMIFLMNIFVLS
ncbi:AEC family transporter [Psychrobacillus sp. L3]|uniref:AEC family transporter n=1 Tax=Psychrobacillus sp. L3 TaxID=3236891 RepID=UPI0036F4326C